MKEQHECSQEARLALIEDRLNNKHKEISDLENKTQRIDENIIALRVEITELTSAMNSFKWVVGVGIALFGGVAVFILQEVIKMI